MAVEGYNPKQTEQVVQQAWLEVDARWVAGLWGLRATGEVKCVLGKVHVGVLAPGARRGEVLVGELAQAIVPTRVRPKAPGEGAPALPQGES